MVKSVLIAYLAIGTLSLLYKTDRLKKDLDVQGPPIKVRIYKLIVTLGAILIWPLRLINHYGKQEEPNPSVQTVLNAIDESERRRQKDQALIEEVTKAYQDAAKERDEAISDECIDYIASMLLLMERKHGEAHWREHFLLDLEKYRREGMEKESRLI